MAGLLYLTPTLSGATIPLTVHNSIPSTAHFDKLHPVDIPPG